MVGGGGKITQALLLGQMEIQPIWKTVWQFNMQQPINPEIALLRTYTKKRIIMFMTEPVHKCLYWLYS